MHAVVPAGSVHYESIAVTGGGDCRDKIESLREHTVSGELQARCLLPWQAGCSFKKCSRRSDSVTPDSSMALRVRAAQTETPNKSLGAGRAPGGCEPASATLHSSFLMSSRSVPVTMGADCCTPAISRTRASVARSSLRTGLREGGGSRRRGNAQDGSAALLPPPWAVGLLLKCSHVRDRVTRHCPM